MPSLKVSLSTHTMAISSFTWSKSLNFNTTRICVGLNSARSSKFAASDPQLSLFSIIDDLRSTVAVCSLQSAKMLDTVFRTSLLEPKMEMTNTINPHHGPRKDSTSYPAVLMKIKGELFHTNYQCYNNYRILILFNEIFALVIFKTEVVQISLQVFIFKFAMAIINLILKILRGHWTYPKIWWCSWEIQFLENTRFKTLEHLSKTFWNDLANFSLDGCEI